MNACSFRFTIVIPILFRGGLILKLVAARTSQYPPNFSSQYTIASVNPSTKQELISAKYKSAAYSRAKQCFNKVRNEGGNSTLTRVCLRSRVLRRSFLKTEYAERKWSEVASRINFRPRWINNRLSTLKYDQRSRTAPESRHIRVPKRG